MKIMAFSDLHHGRVRAEALVAASAEADLAIGAGDFCNMRRALPEAMNLLGGITVPMILVPGNAESDDELRDAAHMGTTVLHGQSVEIGGLRIFGLGYAVPVTPFGDWSCDLAEDDAAALLDRCQGADILITHSPPKGLVDRSSTGLSIGSVAVREAIERIAPQLVLCGHVHDCWGQDGMIGSSRVVNLGPTPNWSDVEGAGA